MKSKRLQQEAAEGSNGAPRRHGVEIDKVLKNNNISEAEKYSILRIKTD